MARRTLARGIYADAYGYEVRWTDAGRRQQKRFAADVPLDELRAFRARKLRTVGERRAVSSGSFTRDVARFLRDRKGRPSFKSDRAHLRPWVERFGRASRFAITRDGVQGAVNEWQRRDHYSPREIRHRVRLLRQVFRVLDPGQPTPCDGVTLPKIVKRKPRPVDAAVIRDVALNLRKQEIKGIGRLRDAKTRARFLVLALTGARPAQVMRAKPDDLDLARGLWYVDPAKGDEGTVLALNEQMRAAWALYAAAGAWGAYDTRSFAKTLRRNGWPKGVRPYQLRHTIGQTLKEQGADLGDIQDQLGHASPETTRQFYVGPSLERLRAISASLDGRLDPFALELPRRTTTRPSEEISKDSDISRHSSPTRRHTKARLRTSNVAKLG